MSSSEAVYLDHAATTPLLPAVLAAMTGQLGRVGNASSLHASGRAARRVAEQSRERLAEAIHASITFGLEEQQGEEPAYLEDGAENRFLVYGRAGTACARCGTPVESFTQAGRTTHCCPRCQPPHPGRKPSDARRKRASHRR